MASERKVVRFLGPAGGLFVADNEGVAVCDPSGALRYRVAIEGVLDAVAVGKELWVATREGLTRVAIDDGAIISTERIDGLHAPGRFLQSSTLPSQPVWHGDVPRMISVAPGRAESPPGPRRRSRCRSRTDAGCCGKRVSYGTGAPASVKRGETPSAIRRSR